MKPLLVCLLALVLSGCVNVTATRTTTVNGVSTTDSIVVKSFLESITDGTYSTTNGMALSTSSATPDQQSISTLSSGIVSLATLFAAKSPTNTVSVATNTAGTIIVTPAKP